MNPIDDADLESVPALLDAQIACARELQEVLDAETRALLAADLPALSELVQHKQQAAERLEQLSRALAAASGGAPGAVIPSLGGEAGDRWQTLRDAADVLRKANLHNGALLSERQARLRWIARQAGIDDGESTYGGPSSSRRLAGPGRHLARA